jgi:predicted unusual protein kinase regulating ubiquinone biosynthesis (AarF/ABC1/UbiB family)
LATGLAGGAAAEGIRRLSQGERPGAANLLLTPANAARLTDRLSRMRGAAMKLGQLLSMEAGDVLAPEVTATLSRLRDDAHAMPGAQLARVLRRAWGEGWEGRFARFSFAPVAAASIGQVHGARARDGRDLAVKVQYPGVRQSIDSDVDNVATLLRLLRLLPEELDLQPLLEEAKAQLHAEADYRLEADYLERYGALLGDDPDFQVPSVDPELSTSEVLVMSFVPGEPLAALEGAAPQLRNRTATRLLALLLRELFEFGLVQTDPNLANYRHEPATGRIGLLDFGATRAYPSGRIEAFRQLLSAGTGGDRASVIEAAQGIGYLRPEDPAPQQAALADMVLVGCEPLRHTGPYDFAGSQLIARLRELGLALTFEHGYWRAPPPDTAFLHRKLGGLLLLCARLGARVDLRRLIGPYLD